MSEKGNKKSENPKKDTDDRMNFGIYIRILGYIKKYLKLVIVCFFLSLIISFLHFGSLGMIKPLGDVIFGDANQILKKLEKFGDWGVWLAEFLKLHVFVNPYYAMYVIITFVVILTVIKNLLRFIQEYTAGYITTKVGIDVSNELFSKVQKLPIRYFSKEGASQITARFMNDIHTMDRGLKDVFSKAICEPLKALGTLILAFVINWKLTLLTCMVLPTAGIFLKKLGKKVKRGAKKTLAEQAQIMGILQEAFTGVRIVKAYQMEERTQTKFEQENKKLMKYQMKVVAADAATNPMMETFVLTIGALVLVLSAHLVLENYMSVGDFCAFYAALAAMLDPIRKLSDFNNRMNSSIAAGERIFEMMDTIPDIQDSPKAIVLEPLHDEIRFEHVSFAYEPGQPVLKDISFSVKHGEHIALVGRSGSGKSTLVSLLLRLYDVTDGAILMDGHNIKDVTMESLRKQIGIVTQEAFLFNDTISANIVCKQQGMDATRIQKAAQASYADIFIETLPQKYETLYGAKGIDLSGGQKHRVALARAIFKEPSILILDEAMANLDAESENYILKALEKFTQGRTAFIIAHRFSTITQVDRILVLEDGKVDGFGKHEELLKQSQVYKSLYEKQTLKYIDNKIGE